MKTPENTILPKAEEQKNYKIEHLPGLDVVLNLNYPNQKDIETILTILKEKPVVERPKSKNELFYRTSNEFSDKVDKLEELKDNDTTPRFHLKFKTGSAQDDVDFILGRGDIDPINHSVRKDFDNRARYAFVGILNEMILSKKIKDLVASDAFQDVAKKHGFAGVTSSEPIAAMVERNSGEKYLIYKYVAGINPQYISSDLVQNFRALFKSNGIEPHDLREAQFMVMGEGNKGTLVLLDTEAYIDEKRLSNQRK